MLASRRILSVAAIAVTATLVASGPALAATTYSWFFNAVVVGSPVPPGQVFNESTGTTPLRAQATATSLVGVLLDAAHDHAVYFPGWQGVPAGGTVSKTASMLSSDATFSDTVAGSDGTATLQDPELGNFTVSVWIKPDDPAGFNLGSTKPSAVSPNVVQKGLSGTSGGFWKLSLGMVKPAATRFWYPFCEFKNGAIDLKPGHNAAKFQMAAGTAYKVECVKAGAIATVNVYTTGNNLVFTNADPAGANFSISNSSAVSVGHKPTSTDPLDVYAGALDNLNITKG